MKKSLRGVMRASCEKRPVAMDGIQNIVDQKVGNKDPCSRRYEVSSQLIGEYVMEILANVDDIVGIRFAKLS